MTLSQTDLWWDEHTLRSGTLFGRKVPGHVLYFQKRYVFGSQGDVVEWVNKNGSRHEFTLPVEGISDEVVTAVITAMKLSQ